MDPMDPMDFLRYQKNKIVHLVYLVHLVHKMLIRLPADQTGIRLQRERVLQTENISLAGNFEREINMSFCYKPTMRLFPLCYSTGLHIIFQHPFWLKMPVSNLVLSLQNTNLFPEIFCYE
jgi:hypothetical protein